MNREIPQFHSAKTERRGPLEHFEAEDSYMATENPLMERLPSQFG